MSPKYRSWQDYQETAAAVFRNLGRTADVDKTESGARGNHKVDVYVSFQQFGQQCRLSAPQPAQPKHKVMINRTLAAWSDVRNTLISAAILSKKPGPPQNVPFFPYSGGVFTEPRRSMTSNGKLSMKGTVIRDRATSVLPEEGAPLNTSTTIRVQPNAVLTNCFTR